MQSEGTIEEKPNKLSNKRYNVISNVKFSDTKTKLSSCAIPSGKFK